MLKHFLNIMGRYLRPYRKYLAGAVLLNFFSQWMNVFSFVVLIPILNILFKIDQTVYTYKEWTWDTLSKEVVVNNGYAFVQQLINEHGAFLTLVIMGVALVLHLREPPLPGLGNPCLILSDFAVRKPPALS